MAIVMAAIMGMSDPIARLFGASWYLAAVVSRKEQMPAPSDPLNGTRNQKARAFLRGFLFVFDVQSV